eukprot:4354669-Ditylum_brightwellii.AAC.1
MDWHHHGLSYALKEEKSIQDNLVSHNNWVNFSASTLMGSARAASDNTSPHTPYGGTPNAWLQKVLFKNADIDR